MSQAGLLNIAGGTAVVLFLTGDSGGAVGPTANNINVVGGVGIDVVGTPGTSTLTINALGTEATVQTTDAVATVIFTQTLAASEAALMEVRVIAAQSDYTSAIGGTFSSVVRRAAAGGAVCAGGPHGNILEDTAGMPDVDFNATGNDIEVLVTGVGGTTYNWRAFIRVTFDN